MKRRGDVQSKRALVIAMKVKSRIMKDGYTTRGHHNKNVNNTTTTSSGCAIEWDSVCYDQRKLKRSRVPD